MPRYLQKGIYLELGYLTDNQQDRTGFSWKTSFRHCLYFMLPLQPLQSKVKKLALIMAHGREDLKQGRPRVLSVPSALVRSILDLLVIQVLLEDVEVQLLLI